MARKKEEELAPDNEKVADPRKLVRSLRDSLNRDGEDKVSWDLTKDDSPTFVKGFISTGSTLLDLIAANRPNGGVPCGKLTEIQGEEASGKSLLCAHIIADTQRRGGVAVYLDTENAANPDFMRRVGVDLGSLIYVQPGTIERAYETIEAVIKTLRAKSSTLPVTILWDSTAASPPQAEIEGSYDGNSRIGVAAKAHALGMRKITDVIGKEQVTLVFTNQLKYAMNAGPYGDPWVTPGGKAVPYHASLRIRLTSSTKLKNEATKEIYGLVTNARVIKSRLGPAHRSIKFEIHFDHGIDDERSWFNVLHDAGCIEKRNGWCYIDFYDPQMGTSGPPPGLELKKNEKTGRMEFQFREKDWATDCRSTPALRAWAVSMLEKLLVVSYSDTRPERDGQEVPNEGPENYDTDGEAV